jgi:hypothetical protein
MFIFPLGKRRKRRKTYILALGLIIQGGKIDGKKAESGKYLADLYPT